jgi:hypothetical protein
MCGSARLRDQFTFGGSGVPSASRATGSARAARGEHVRCLGHDNGGEVQRHADSSLTQASLGACRETSSKCILFVNINYQTKVGGSHAGERSGTRARRS